MRTWPTSGSCARDKHNALDGEMFLALRDAADRLREETGVRAVVISGDGPSFCSGLDLASFGAGGPLSGDDLLGRPDGEVANLAQSVSYHWQLVPAPVIAAIHGACFGGGLQIALGADIRFATPDARLSVMEMKWGLIPDMGIIGRAAAARPDRRREGADLHRPGRRRARGGRARPRHARRRRPARRRERAGDGDRGQVAGRDPRREAALQRDAGTARRPTASCSRPSCRRR